MAEKTPSMDADSTSLITNTSPNVNVVLSSNSKPVRFGSFKNHIHSAGKESPVLNSTDLNKQLPTMTTPLPSQKEQQVSISVPSVVAATSDESKVAPNVNNSTNVGANSGSGYAGLGQHYISCNVTPPNSASIRQTAPIALETKLLRRTSSLRILMPKLSADNISYSPGSTFSGLANWSIDNREKSDGNQTDKSATEISKLNRKESYKAQRKNYRREKKRVASELLNSLQDPAVIVLADWLKVRGTLKSWTKLWCVLKPGLLLLYKSPKTKSSHWVGTILLTSCHVIERPSKKDGFCFKLFHPLEQSIWAPRGPDKETIGAVVQPLPTAYLIFRAPSQAAGKCWMDALELSLRCSGLLLRSNSTTGNAQLACGTEGSISHETQWSEADYEKHFNDQDLDGDSQNEAVAGTLSGVDTDSESDINDGPIGDNQMELIDDEEPLETPYVLAVEGEFNTESGEQVEELGEENKSLIWCLVKQVRPGMDLSKVVLPTFILEPRSFLDKLSDSYYHVDILSKVVNEDDPLTRMKLVVHWYLSGFYKKPKGLKKPYNPILGETFRCYWQHPTGSRTYYIAEQVSHHPPVTAFYVTNRQEGFSISCSILAKSKFYGNSTSAVLDGEATLTILPRGESYTLNTPYAHCKGILMGTLSMELGGKVNIDCENTGYKTELEFKLRPFLGGVDQTNVIVGKIKLIKETLATIHGRWDNEIRIKDSKTGEETVLFVVNKDTIKSRLKRYVVPIDSQLPNESERLWHLVSEAIRRDDQVGATEEKTILEDGQRNAAKERKTRFTEWEPAHFQQDILTGKWVYKYADLRPWDPRNDVKQYEIDYQVLTKTRHLAPTVRTASIVNVNAIPIKRTTDRAQSAINILKNTRIQTPTIVDDSDSSRSQDNIPSDAMDMSKKSVHTLILAVEQVNKALDEHTRQLMVINAKLERMHFSVAPRLSTSPPSSRTIVQTAVAQVITESVLLRTVACVIVALIATYFLKWLLN